MTIRVAQYKGVSLTSRLIKFCTGGVYSHTAIMLEEDCIVEAWEGTGSVRIIKSLSEGHTPGTPIDIYHVDIPPHKEKEFREFVMGEVGKSYSMRGLIAFYFNSINWRRDDEWFCSQLMVGGCHSINEMFWGEGTKPYQISPSSLVRNSHFRYINSYVTA